MTISLVVIYTGMLIFTALTAATWRRRALAAEAQISAAIELLADDVHTASLLHVVDALRALGVGDE